MDNLYQYIIERTSSGRIDRQTGIQLIKLLKESTTNQEDIAIISVAAELPKAKDVEQFWQNLHDGVDCVSPFPASRRSDTDEYLGYMVPGNKIPEYMEGGYLEEIDKFDYRFFNLSYTEASLMDPYQRLFLQTAFQSLEAAGYGGARIQKTRTGVFVGYSNDGNPEYRQLIQAIQPSYLSMATAGNLRSIIASRIAYLLDLKGPSMLVDTACSSSLVSVHLACKAIHNGDCDMALAGSIKVSMLPVIDENREFGILSSIYRARTFDESSDGTGFSEGVISILLKPLKQAIKDKDIIYAVIKGSAVNQDGNSNGITAPNARAQTDVIVNAWKNAKVNPESISYLEAHGTGTRLGDPIEIEGMSKAFKQYTDRNQFCGVGSVKSNMGHLDNAAGLAGLLKMVMALKNKQLPPTLHFKRSNTKIDFLDSPIYVSDTLRQWERGDTPRRCGVSSFGLSGTNCHVVLEEAPEIENIAENTAKPHPQLFMLSARREESLRALIQTYVYFLEEKGDSITLEDICYTANTGRGHYEYRLACTVSSLAELREKMTALAECQDFANMTDPYVSFGYHRVIVGDRKLKKLGDLYLDERKEFTLQVKALLDTMPKDPTERNAETLARISRLYVQGAEIDFISFYLEKRQKIALPTYPFLRDRCWIEVKSAPYPQSVVTVKNYNHPLVSRCVLETMNLRVYSTMFSIASHWMLEEHKVLDSYVVPGTTYLEMVRFIGHTLYPDQHLTIKNLIFFTPFSVHDSKEKEMHVILTIEAKGEKFTIVSQGEEEDQWITHAEGWIQAEEPAPLEHANISLLQKRFPEKIDFRIDNHHTRGVHLGPRWYNFADVRLGSQELLARLKLPDEFRSDLEQFHLHPSMMDNAVNVAISHVGEGLYLPFSYKSLRIYGSMTETVYSHISWNNSLKENAETATFDIRLMKEDGTVIAEATDYTIKKVPKTGFTYQELSNQEHMYYQLNWVEKPTLDQGENTHSNILVFKGETEQAEKVLTCLHQENRMIIEVGFGNTYRKIDERNYEITDTLDDYNRLVDEIKDQDFTQIVHMASLVLRDDSSAADHSKQLERSVMSLFYLTKALNKNRIKQEIDIVLIGTNTMEVSGEEHVIHPYSYAMFGLGKVVEQECPRYVCRCLDLDGETPLDLNLAELTHQSSDFHTAIRAGKRYVPQLQPIKLDSADQDNKHEQMLGMEIKAGGTYIISGGAGGLGLEVSSYLSANQKVNLALIGRRPLPERDQWDALLSEGHDQKLRSIIMQIRRMEENGTQVTYFSADITNRSRMEQVLKQVRARFGPIRGVIHAAGNAGDGFLLRKEEAVFRSVLDPKMRGTQLLDELTEDDPLDFFVLFSSVTALTGGVGQGDYTAANNYLDAFAYARNKRGKRTLAINWPAWKETGMAVDYGLEDNGIFKAIRTRTALESFERMMEQERPRVITGFLNGAFSKSLLETHFFQLSTDLQALLKQAEKPRAARKNMTANFNRPLKIVASSRESQFVTKMEARIARIWAEVLSLEEIDIFDDLFSLGGDSIIAVKISAMVSQDVGKEIEVADLFEYQTVAELVTFILAGEKEAEEDTVEEIIEAVETARVPQATIMQEVAATLIPPMPEQNEKSASQPVPTIPFVRNDSSKSIANNLLIKTDAYELNNHLSWRQFNCYDRGLANLFGDENRGLINYFKLFLGLKRGYHLSEHGLAYSFVDEQRIFGYPHDQDTLGKFGFSVELTNVTDTKWLPEAIIDLINQRKLVMVSFNEYFTYYTPFYLREHTDHTTIINGYDKEKGLYYIIDHNHVHRGASQRIVYESFMTTFSVLEEVYNFLIPKMRCLVTLNRFADCNPMIPAFDQEYKQLLLTLLAEKQAGSDIDMIVRLRAEETDYFNDQNLNELYVKLGAKELFLETLTHFFCPMQDSTEAKLLTMNIIQDSNKLVNKFVTSIYRKSMLSHEDIAQYRERIVSNTQFLFRIMAREYGLL
ncbi:SDR family NAD(P)-dependent oxidoreductase [Brevibacillus antibioticus]|uniref:SDR family NAD(P)-dependent oxidoreductase n=1 Tax=Brevibacillus antibioticus TaxID=2570228 RepID=A0A4U2Y3U4_9BACL|nr:SDR family NAD(P)-dependent oxidoreductase [Brevibacillus antibioticus]TKI55087.1 SDR family NAD(P)-dependent oxidoreductase [Brevibacillus antibioticus]